MSRSVKSCYIRSLEKPSLNIYLPDNKPVFVGRSPETGIQDTKCSRQQVRLCGNYAKAIVTVQQVGTHASGFNGFKMEKNIRFVAKHTDHVELLYGKYAFEIEFNPPPQTEDSERKKRSYELEEVDVTEVDEAKCNKKMLKLHHNSDEELDNNRKEKECSSKGDDSTQTTAAVDSPIITESSNNTEWESIDEGKLVIYTLSSVQNQDKVAAYDMDNTLIKTKSGRVFPKNHNDWELLYPHIPDELKLLHECGYKVVIFTNQAALSSGKVNINNFKQKIENIVKKIGVPIQVFIAAGYNIYRKPRIGMWNYLQRKKNGRIPIDKLTSFYIGDAAGRPKNWDHGKKKDHSCVDRLFALNLDLKFYTPEEHFLKYRKSIPYNLPMFNPKENLLPIDNLDVIKFMLKEQEIVLMVGSPGSGKSHFVKNYLKEYGYVNRDILGSWQKCVVITEQYLDRGKSVVIDNTNPDPATRQRYTEIAKKRNIPVRCFVMTTSIDHAKHNIKFRSLTDSSHVPVNDIVINSYAKNYVPPTLEEGFKEIVEINFIPKFNNKEDQKLYEMYLVES
ncbi:uncharacterized protein F21D5.5-like [Pseudomyrmex gracilis]|uniref:uncharacterized protein F21D5.5-like n=1 Tax=Pseudomyrmex gracilis TaxID=219809 RepID=UPI000995DB33|nr:uncharacterized protein F21D5.5-like [Pseudomyrmex gracilis]